MALCEPVAQLDLCLYRSDNFSHQITWLDNDGDPIDLTGYTAKMEARRKVGGSILMTATESSGLDLGGAAGTIDIKLIPTQTDIAFRDNVYDLEVTSPGAEVTTLVQGAFTVIQDVTR